MARLLRRRFILALATIVTSLSVSSDNARRIPSPFFTASYLFTAASVLTKGGLYLIKKFPGEP
ncbi:hypothetical protein DSO57_1010262 [Entomophthora muscae]|uniref:Uncharacterized protein n=1 Tax=Entomophthora muscae TaxID=34485 RepID=A0ACC2TU23_9FUNG|nr:hypothetical protein DSO57_1010262 [Entomophthora muscae]